MKTIRRLTIVSVGILVLVLLIGAGKSQELTRKEKLEALQEKFLKGEITEETYKEMKSSLIKPVKEDPDNLVKNHSFEKDTDEDGIADNWEPKTMADGKPRTPADWITLDDGNAYGGKRCMKVAPPKKSNAEENWHQVIDVKPGKRYFFSFWCKSENLKQTDTSYNGVRFQDAQGKTLKTVYVPMAAMEGSVDWKKLAKAMVAPPGSVNVYMWLRIYEATGIVWYDDVTFKELR